VFLCDPQFLLLYQGKVGDFFLPQLLVGFLLGTEFSPEDGGSTHFSETSANLLDYHGVDPKRQSPSFSPL
jgi:hypothetical protein